jgi:hypothetical protein
MEGDQVKADNRRCRLGLHHFVDFPDPNPETHGQREAQGYRACTRCTKTKDVDVYSTRGESLRARSWWMA